MSWNVTEYEGVKCYEQDGQRLFRTQDIDTIEAAERRQAEINREQMKYDRIRYIDECDRTYDGDHIEEDYKPTPKWNAAVTIIVLCAWLLMFYLASRAGG